MINKKFTGGLILSVNSQLLNEFKNIFISYTFFITILNLFIIFILTLANRHHRQYFEIERRKKRQLKMTEYNIDRSIE